MYIPPTVRSRVTYLQTRLSRYFHLQLFLTFCAWPILAAWGLPLSPASLLGNLLFAPFLSCFLLLSSFILFTELFFIPNSILINLLETLTTIWYHLLSTSNRSWLFITAHPPFYITAFLPLVACSIMLYKQWSYKRRTVIFIALYIMLGIIIPRVRTYTTKTFSIPYYTSKLTVLQSRGHTALIDPGIIGRHVSAPQKISYTVLPFLNKKGITHLSCVIIARPSHMVFKALTTLIKSIPVTTLYIPSFTAKAPNRTWAAWEQLLKTAKKYNTHIVYVNKAHKVWCGRYDLNLTPDRRHRSKNKFSYHNLCCTYT